VGLTGEAYTNPVELTASWQLALLICAALAIVGAVLALGIDNKVLSGGGPAEPAAPAPGDCLTCGVDSPPTHIKPAPAGAA
jgi:hypothetical protein